MMKKKYHTEIYWSIVGKDICWINKLKKRLKATIIANLLLLPILLLIFNATEASAENPVLRVPKMKTPPKIDGRFDTNEWADASAVTGFSNYHHKDMYPEAMRTLWYLGYDDDNLYLAMHYAVPEGVDLKADTKNPNDNDNENSCIFGDHVEIQLTPHSAQRALQQGFGFYKLVVNPVAIFADTWWFNGIPGSEPAWNSGAEIKCSIDKRNWWLEIAWPLSSMQSASGRGTIQKADGLKLITQLVRSGFCSGYAYAGWTPDAWLSFDKFFTIILDPDAPVMQFVKKGDIVYGSLDTEVKMKGAEGQQATVKLEILNPDKSKVFASKKDLTLSPNLPVTASFKKNNLAVASWAKKSGRCAYNLSVTSKGKTVFSMSSPFIKHTEDFDQRTYKNYLTSRPKADYKCKFAYYPVNGKARVYLDLDVIGELPEAVKNAKFLRLLVTTRDKKQTVVRKTVPIKNMTASELFTIGELNGAYTATVELLSTEKKVVSKRTYDFVREHYAWENNTIGEERVVIPPFRPLQIRKRVIKSRAAEFRMGKGGLWDGVTVFGKDLLRKPMRIEGVFDGKQMTWQGETLTIKGGAGKTFPPEYDKYRFFKKNCPKIPFDKLADTDGYEASVSSSGSIGDIKTTLHGIMDYDGFYKIKLTMTPQNGPVKVDRLDIVLDLWKEARDLVVMRNGAWGPSYLLAEKNGTVWESKELAAKPVGFKGTFIPAVAIGDGTYSLQFRAASDEGWMLDDDISCILIENKDGKPTLRLRIINKTALLDKERSLIFALIPLPAKPAPKNWRRIVWGYDQECYAHTAFGWRSYGTGGDNWYLPNDDEYRLLGECLHYPEKHPELTIHGEVKGNAKRARKWPVLMYSSAVAVGAPLPAVKTYGGQWYGDSAVKFSSNTGRVGKRSNLNGRFLWDKKEDFSEARPKSYDDDLVDNYMWYHKKLIELANTNGTMWDNQEMAWYKALDTGAFGYLRDDGHVQPGANILMRRQLMKRLYTMGWLSGKPPFYFSKAFHQAPFMTIARGIEGAFYIMTKDGTFFDKFPDNLIDFRTFGGSSNIPFRYDANWHPPKGTDKSNLRPIRSVLAVAILHDHAVRRRFNKAFWQKTLQTLDREVGFLDTKQQAEFLPYWNNADVIRFAGNKRPKGLFASVYKSQTNKGKALIWLVNASDDAVTEGLWIDTRKLVGKNGKSLTLRDAETGEKFTAKKAHLWENIKVKAKDYRAMILE